MQLLKNENKSIQFEAIMMIGIFLKNIPKAKNPDVKSIIQKNKVGLLNFIQTFQTEESEFIHIKELISHQLQNL